MLKCFFWLQEIVILQLCHLPTIPWLEFAPVEAAYTNPTSQYLFFSLNNLLRDGCTYRDTYTSRYLLLKQNSIRGPYIMGGKCKMSTKQTDISTLVNTSSEVAKHHQFILTNFLIIVRMSKTNLKQNQLSIIVFPSSNFAAQNIICYCWPSQPNFNNLPKYQLYKAKKLFNMSPPIEVGDSHISLFHYLNLSVLVVLHY